MTSDKNNKALQDSSLMMRAIHHQPVERTPVWLMRQAGRYMAEYRAVREKTSFLTLCKTPRLCAEVMQTAVEKLGVDAAIIFSDLLLILEPMGFGLEFAAQNAPVIHRRFEDANDLNRIHELEDVSALSFVFETVQETRKVIDKAKPIIGFAGAPFTLASYAIEGGSSRTFERTKSLMYEKPSVWNELMGRISRSVARYLNEQIKSGAQIIQLFDSWIGCLSVEDYQRFVLPHSKSLIEMIQPGTPVIHFGTGNPSLLEEFAVAGGEVIGVDWRIPIDVAWKRVGFQRSVQGNLDPVVLLTNPDVIRREAHRILNLVAGRPGFIFNLGHGILRQTPVENVIALVEAVHDFPLPIENPNRFDLVNDQTGRQ